MSTPISTEAQYNSILMNNIRIAPFDLHPTKKLVSLPELLLPTQTIQQSGVSQRIRNKTFVQHILQKINSSIHLALPTQGLHQNPVRLDIRNKISLKHFVEQRIGNANVPVETEGAHENVVGLGVGFHAVPVSILEEIERGTNEVAVGNENLENAVKVFGERLAIEVENGVEGIEGFVGQIGLGVDFDKVSEEGGSDGVRIEFEATEEIVEEREVFGATQLEKEDEVAGVSPRFLWPEQGLIRKLLLASAYTSQALVMNSTTCNLQVSPPNF